MMVQSPSLRQEPEQQAAKHQVLSTFILLSQSFTVVDIIHVETEARCVFSEKSLNILKLFNSIFLNKKKIQKFFVSEPQVLLTIKSTDQWHHSEVLLCLFIIVEP
jgi:hypothetical protein